MKFSEALLVSLLGMVLIMCVLAALMGIIYLMNFVIRKASGRKKKTTEVAAADKPLEAPGSCGELRLEGVDERTAAIIMAIVADKMQAPINQLHFISIKEVKGE